MSGNEQEEIIDEELAAVSEYEVTLSSCGNPDHRQNPNMPLPGLKNARVKVKSLVEASRVCLDYIAENDLGGGNWTGGNVFLAGDLVASVSYNGRVWRETAPSKRGHRP